MLSKNGDVHGGDYEEWHLLGFYTVISEEGSAYIIRATRIGELGTTLAVTINRRTLRRTVANYG
jgi:hypothetical protein